MDGWKDETTTVLMERWVNERMDEWKDGWTDGWI